MSSRAIVIVYLLFVWFVISFVTNIIGPLMPVIIEDFQLSLTMAGFLPFSFFLAYGIVSIPAGFLVESWGAKRTLIAAFAVNFVGAAAFSLAPSYFMAVGALFVIGVGMAMLQVVVNPLMRITGGAAHFAFFSVLGQLVFGMASFVSPLVFSAIMTRLRQGEVAGLLALAPEHVPWVIFYWAFAVVFALTITITATMKIPEIELQSDERADALSAYADLFKDPKVLLFFLGIAAYVGAEQMLANWMSQFLHDYHGVSPLVGGAQAVGWFWGLMSVGCLVGLLLLKLLDSKLVLRIFTALAMICVSLALFGPKEVALLAFPASGFFLSVMYSVIFSLALNSVAHNHGAFSGILCSGILGGAIFPLAVGALGEAFGLRLGMLAIFVVLGFIFSFGVWPRPLVRNEVLDIAKLSSNSNKSA